MGLLSTHTLTAKRKAHSRRSLLSLPHCPFCKCLSLSPLPQASKLSQPPLMPGSSTELNDPSGTPPSDLLPSLLQNKIDFDNLIPYHSQLLKGKDAIFTSEVSAHCRDSILVYVNWLKRMYLLSQGAEYLSQGTHLNKPLTEIDHLIQRTDTKETV